MSALLSCSQIILQPADPGLILCKIAHLLCWSAFEQDTKALPALGLLHLQTWLFLQFCSSFPPYALSSICLHFFLSLPGCAGASGRYSCCIVLKVSSPLCLWNCVANFYTETLPAGLHDKLLHRMNFLVENVTWALLTVWGNVSPFSAWLKNKVLNQFMFVKTYRNEHFDSFL